MKRSFADVLRRGFDNTVANWPLILIRIAEGIVLVLLAVVALVAAIIPVIVSLGINASLAQDPTGAAEAVMAMLTDHWMIVLYVVAVVTVVLVLFVAIHSFVEAGSARVYVDGERAAGAVAVPQRANFHVFTAERWLSGAKQDWWSVFWIYNLAWGVAGLIILAPLVIVGALVFLLHDNEPLMLGVTCVGLVMSIFILLVVAVVTNVWCEKAIVVCSARMHRATGALGEAWREFRTDAGRHIAVALVLFLLMVVGSMFFASISFVGGMSDSPGYVLALMPLQLLGSFANSVFSTIVSAWFLASFAGLSVEPR